MSRPAPPPRDPRPAPLLEVAALGVRRRGRSLLADVTLRLDPGECLGLLGPNGAGKSTFLRAALGLETVQGRTSLGALGAAERARRVAYLPQGREVAWPMPVRDLVALGRLPHLARGAALPPATAAAVAAVLADLGLSDLADRPATELSGGELARTLLARALVQDTPLILADEPVAGLDPAHQIEVMRLLAGLARAGRGVVVTCHDLGLAARFCTRLAVIAGGRLVADGPPEAVLTPELLARVFGLRARVEQGPEGLICLPLDTLGPHGGPGGQTSGQPA
ncbi:MAG: ABC transporter ATP-binding protein [Alkalilacustris sp.]